MTDMKKVDWGQVEKIMESKKSWLREKLKMLSATNSLIDWSFGGGDVISKDFEDGGLSFIFFCLWYKHEDSKRKPEFNPSRLANLNEKEMLVFSEFVGNLLKEDKSLQGRLVENRFGLCIYNLRPKDLPMKRDI